MFNFFKKSPKQIFKKNGRLSCALNYRGAELDIQIEFGLGDAYELYMGSPIVLSRADQAALHEYLQSEGFIDQAFKLREELLS